MFAVVLMYLRISRRTTLQFFTSLHKVLTRTSVNQNRFWELLESHRACQTDQKNQRMFETSNSKSSTHLYAENHYNRTEPTASYYTPTPSIFLPCCFDFQPKKLPFWLGKEMLLIYWIIMFKSHCARHIYNIQSDLLHQHLEIQLKIASHCAII